MRYPIVRTPAFLHKHPQVSFLAVATMARCRLGFVVINTKATMDLRSSDGEEDPTFTEIRNAMPNEIVNDSRHRPAGQDLDAQQQQHHIVPS